MTGFDMVVRRARTADDWRTVRALRLGFTDAFDEARNTSTYLLFAGACAIGTTRTSVSVPPLREPLPAQRVFGREIVAAFGTDGTWVEATLTFVDPRAVRDPQDALVQLFRVHMARCAAENAEALVVAVRESQMGFYRRRFNMEILSGAERWPGTEAPRVLMGLAWTQHSAELLRRIPALAASAEDEDAFERS